MSRSSQHSRLRITSSGIGVLVTSFGALAVWAFAGYAEFALVGVVGLLLVGLALLWPRVVSETRFSRVVPPRLVGRGDVMTLTLAAEVDRVSQPTRLIDQLTGVAVPIMLPSLKPGRPVLVRYRVRALRRGVHQLGPLLEERTDPLSLVTRTVEHDVVDDVLVHPRIHRLGLNDTGARLQQSRARVPRLSDDPLADFRSLREYVVGDDERLVHWPTVARTGVLMVRDHFELRRTTRTVILETFDRSVTEAGFEDAVEIAASIVCESIERNIAVSVRSRDRAFPGRSAPLLHRTEALEFFSRVSRTVHDDTIPAAALRIGRDTSDQIFLIAGASSPLIAQLATAPSISRHLVVIRLVDRSAKVRRLAVRSLDVESVEQFAQLWTQALVA